MIITPTKRMQDVPEGLTSVQFVLSDLWLLRLGARASDSRPHSGHGSSLHIAAYQHLLLFIKLLLCCTTHAGSRIDIL
jgi:hypothetical protein